ncbi:MAG TPA: DUF86 domain-containing protein [Candidatus Kapabacteria bacterium]|nr:DUF86 domain-containing protein [Candidatus Kapabacteria bacterium]
MNNKDRQIILAILNYIDNINRTHTLFTNRKEVFLENNDYQYSIAFALLQIGELVGKMDLEINDKPKIKSLRNRIVHGYGSIDKDLLWEISHQNIKDLRNELERIIGL